MTPYQIARYISEDLSFKAGILINEDKELGEVLADQIEESGFDIDKFKEITLELCEDVINKLDKIVSDFNERSKILGFNSERSLYSAIYMDLVGCIIFVRKKISNMHFNLDSSEFVYLFDTIIGTIDDEYRWVYEPASRPDSLDESVEMVKIFEDFYTTIEPILLRTQYYYGTQ